MALVEFAAWCCASEGNRPSTISGKLSAVKYFHVVEAGVELPVESPLLKRLILGITRAHLKADLHRRYRVPIALDVLLKYGGRAAISWGNGGRVLFLCLLLTYFIGARAHELFQNDEGKVHEVHCLIRNDIAFFENDRQLSKDVAHLATRVEFRFRGHKGDQGQAGTVLMRSRNTTSGPESRVETGGGAVALMVELLSYNRALSGYVPLAGYVEEGVVRVWTYRQATAALRQLAGQAGLDPKKVTLHSLRIGTATVLAAGGDISDRVIQREGRWKSGIEMYKVYTRNNIADSIAVSKKLTDAGKGCQTGPGQGTSWKE